ncbi:MAG: type II secretion system GspH family protein [Ruminococcus sp.]|nr:type II secretion system GspH family protein [Ruminococcus sp.]
MLKKKNHKGFTLIEMVIVISIIGVLAAIIIPSILNYVHKAERAADKVTARLIGTTVVNLMIEYPSFEADFYKASSMKWYVTIDGESYYFRNVARADGSKSCYGRDHNENGSDKKNSLKQSGRGWEFVDLKNNSSTNLTKKLNSRLDEIIGGNGVNNTYIPMRSTGYKHPAEDCNHDAKGPNTKYNLDEKAQKRCKSETYSYTDKWIVGYSTGPKDKVKGQVEVWAGDSYGTGTNGPRVRLWPSPPSYY